MNKKIFAAAAACMLMMTACGTADNSDIANSESAVVSEAETTSETEETQIETEAKTTEAEAEADEDVVEGDGYRVIVSSEEWTDFSQYITQISELAEDSEMASGLSAEDFEGMSEGIYIYKNNVRINFNIAVTDAGAEIPTDMLEMYLDIIKLQYESMDSAYYLGGEITKINGNDCLKIVISTYNGGGGDLMKAQQFILFNGTKQYVLTYTAHVDVFDEGMDAFMKIAESFEFIG